MCGELAWQCRMLYREVVTFDHHGQEKRVIIEFGVVPVRLPDIPENLLHMGVVRGFGQKPMMLLTTLAKNTSRDALWQVVEGFRIHDMPDFHFYAIADGTSDVLKKGRR